MDSVDKAAERARDREISESYYNLNKAGAHMEAADLLVRRILGRPQNPATLHALGDDDFTPHNVD